MNVSIAALGEDLDTTVQGIQAAISLYALVMAAFKLPPGKLSDNIGKKRTFYIGVVLFGIGYFVARRLPSTRLVEEELLVAEN